MPDAAPEAAPARPNIVNVELGLDLTGHPDNPTFWWRGDDVPAVLLFVHYWDDETTGRRCWIATARGAERGSPRESGISERPSSRSWSDLEPLPGGRLTPQWVIDAVEQLCPVVVQILGPEQSAPDTRTDTTP